MTGLESIIQQIVDDARAEAEEQLADARKEADDIEEAAREEASKKAQAVIQEGEQRAADIRERAESAALLEKRSQMLLFKQNMIRDTIEEAKASLEGLPDGEYFEILRKLALRNAQDGQGEMYLNKNDLQRLPQSFEAELNQALSRGKITVSHEPRNVESGFLLVYGGVDINCTFRAIFEDAYDELRDVAGKLLFSQA